METHIIYVKYLLAVIVIIQHGFQTTVAMEIQNCPQDCGCQGDEDTLLIVCQPTFHEIMKLSSIIVHPELVKHLFLNSSNLELMPDLDSLVFLETIDISHNQISKISNETFAENSLLKTIDLSFNKIETIPFGIFHGLGSIKTVILNDNKIHTLEKAFTTDQLSLVHFDVSNNAITSLETDFLLLLQGSNSTNPKTFNFSHNDICSWQSGGQKLIPKNEFSFTLDLAYNNIIYFNENFIEKIANDSNAFLSFLISGSPKEFRLQGNPLHCDCQMKETVQLIKNYIPFIDFLPMPSQRAVHLFIETTFICKSPKRHADKNAVLNLSSQDFTCNYGLDDCPNNAECMYNTTSSKVEVKCPQIKTQIPSGTEKAYFSHLLALLLSVLCLL